MSTEEDNGVGHAIFRAFTKRSPKSESRSASVRAGQLLKRVGGKVKDAASKAGVSPSSFRAWLSGKSSPKAQNSKKLNRANREELTPPGRRERLLQAGNDGMEDGSESRDFIGAAARPLSGGFVVVGEFKVSEDVRERTLNLAAHLSSSDLEDLLGAHFRGDSEVMTGILQDAVHGYHSGMELISLSDVKFDAADWGGE